MSEIKELTEQLIAFRDVRDWKQFHNPKDLAIALSIEASELLEVFLWKDPEAASIDRIKEELADVMAYSLLLAHECNLNISMILEEKMRKNNLKYPVEQSKGSSKKYTELK